MYDGERQKFKGPSDKLWKDICNKLDDKLSPKHLYTIVIENRKNILNEIQFLKVSNEESSESDEALESNESENIDNENLINFDIKLSSDEWVKMKCTVTYHRQNRSSVRTYQTLKPHEWSDFIHRKFWEKTHLPCKISYKRCQISEYGANYLRLFGKCSACGASLTGKIVQKPVEQESVTISCSYTGEFKTCTNSDKRKLLKEQKECYVRKMIEEKKTPSAIRREEAHLIMDYGDFEPSHLPTLNAMRIIKHKEMKSQRLDENPINALSILKETIPYKNVIHASFDIALRM